MHLANFSRLKQTAGPFQAPSAFEFGCVVRASGRRLGALRPLAQEALLGQVVGGRERA
jgi:hypothetical protein